MESHERKKYISIHCIGACANVFNVSVRLHDDRTMKEQIEVVWNSVKTIIVYLEKHADRSTYQQEICAESHLNENINYTHKIASGPMMPLLTCLHLASVIDGGVSITVETYGGKLSKRVSYSVNNTMRMSDLDAALVANELSRDLPSSAPFMISAFHGLIKEISGDFCETILADKNNSMIFGIGCTVGTEQPVLEKIELNLENKSNSLIASQSINSPVVPTDLELQKYRLENISFLKKSNVKQKSSSTADVEFIPAFTVINVETPPFSKLCSNPHKWFRGAPCSFIPKTEQCAFKDKDVSGNDEESIYSDSQSDEDIDNDLTPIDSFKKKSSKVLYPNVAVGCKSHVTYPGFGGILPFAMQSTTIETKKHLKSTSFLGMNNVVRTMCYNVSGRLATGEYNVPMKTSTSVGRVHYDISGTSDNAAFNMKSCMDRQDSFSRNNKITLSNMLTNGSPARIEIAYESAAPHLNNETILNGMDMLF
jgi:hypothetical protein